MKALNIPVPPTPHQSPDSETRGQTVSGCFSPPKSVWLAEGSACSTAAPSSLPSRGRQASLRAVRAFFVSRLALHQVFHPPSWQMEGSDRI